MPACNDTEPLEEEVDGAGVITTGVPHVIGGNLINGGLPAAPDPPAAIC